MTDPIPIPANDACPRCGAGLSAPERLQGLCARCLLVAGLDAHAEDEARDDDAPRRPAPAIEALAPFFPDLEVQELVGQGGMGAVYRVRQTKLGRVAALKVLALDAEASPAFGERFEREAKALAAIAHENIVAVHDCGRAGPFWYLLMEHVDGVSLRQMIRAREVDARTALGIVAQICDALQHAHDHGIVHRDVKPENVLVDRRGKVKVLDFGLAKLMRREPRTGTLTETGQVMGTPRYMAPEQWERPLAVDHRADIYAVGVVFYELLTGELPIGAFALPSQRGAPDARVDPVVMKTLAKEPERRYQHASEVRTDVRRIQETPPAVVTAGATAGAAKAPVADDLYIRRDHLMRAALIGLAVAGCLTIAGLPIVVLALLFSSPTDPSDEVASIPLVAGSSGADEPMRSIVADADPRAACVADALWRLYVEREARVLGDPVEVVPGTVHFEIGSLAPLAAALECAAESWLRSPATRVGAPSEGYHLESDAGTCERAPSSASKPAAFAVRVAPDDPCGLGERGTQVPAGALAPDAFLRRIDRRRWMPALHGAITVEATSSERPTLRVEFADGTSTIVHADLERDPAYARLFEHARRALERR